MAGQITLPGIGPVDKKWVLAGGAAVVGIVGYAYFRRGSGAADTPETVQETPDAGGDISTDSGYGNMPGATGNSNGSWTQVDPDTIDTIQEWTADVVERLSGADWEPNFIYATLGKWFACEGLTEDEKRLVRAALVAGGTPPGGAPPIKSAIPTPTPTPTPPPDKRPPPTPTPTPVPRPAPPKPSPPAGYVQVTVAKYTTVRPPWNSTLWGIAQHYGYGSSAGNYLTIWNDARNVQLKALRKDPKAIRPGDVVWVKPK